MSQTLYEQRTPRDEKHVLDATYHDVQIKQVQIINPNSGTVTFKEHHDPVTTIFQTPQLAKTETRSSNSPLKDRVDDDEQDRKDDKNILQDPINPHGLSVRILNVPLDPNLVAGQEEPRTVSRSFHRDLHQFDEAEEKKRRHREDLMMKKQQIIQSLSSIARRPSSKHRNSEPQFYEVSPGVMIPDRPLSRVVYSPNRLATVPRSGRRRTWVSNRSGSSRAVSSVSSSRWKVDEPLPPKPNLFIKMPFKQVPALTMDAGYKMSDDLVHPGEEMRATTAFTLSRVRHVINGMPDPGRLDSRQGRLLKGRLKPLRPVKYGQPGVRTCQGIQPENRKQVYSPSPSRQRHLKQQYVEVCKMHEVSPLEGEYERRMKAHSVTPDESLHRTSPQPEDDPDYQDDVYHLNLQPDALHRIDETPDENNQVVEIPEYTKYERQVERPHRNLANCFDEMHLESNVIY